MKATVALNTLAADARNPLRVEAAVNALHDVLVLAQGLVDDPIHAESCAVHATTEPRLECDCSFGEELDNLRAALG